MLLFPGVEEDPDLGARASGKHTKELMIFVENLCFFLLSSGYCWL